MTQEQGRKRPFGLQRLFFRFPIYLYRAHLGWLLGKRFLLLNHTGRKSGLPRQTVLEVAHYDVASDTYTIASGFGTRSDWYRNLQHNPDVAIQIGRRKTAAHARFLSPDESGQAMVRYAQQYPQMAKRLIQVLGFEGDGSDDRYYQIGNQHIHFVALASQSNRAAD
ncbi:MAG: nitroreductase family deazaflavin-dependent oxidoreductase [Anaerolineales bacterium]|nr:nitroreductase family deazaflavin-dependent oxidoreductase [Anaerolineales bacterium]